MSLTTDLRWLLSGNPRVSLANRRRAPGTLPRLLARPLARHPLSHRPRRLNALLAGLEHADRYLEIGISKGETLQVIQAPHKVGVDPAPAFDLNHLPAGVEVEVATSDDYFAGLGPEVTFDLAYLDGLHHFEQTYRDVLHSLAHVPVGPLLIDDTVPSSALTALRDQEEAARLAVEQGEPVGPWHGDVWKVVEVIALAHPELELRTMMGSGNPQTLLWRAEAGATSTPAPSELLEQIAGLDFDECFGSGVPTRFNPTTEDEAIATCLASLSGRR